MNDVIARLTTALADRYRVTRELGAGGMATVYLAHDLRHERDVAIKVLHPDLGAALGGERFLTEIRTTARLQHPHILPLLDSGEADGLLYYVMPFIAGETLRARLDRERQLPIDESVMLAREIADALQHAHDAGIVHRDIKPDNVLLQGGHAVVADFGIALAVQQAAGQRLTQTGLSLGTPQYMAPEQATGERTIDARADVYALGAVVYEMLTGEPPFTGATSQAVVARLLTVAPAPMSQVRNTVPAALEEAVMRALAKLPADRFATARAFADTIQRSVGTAPATVSPAAAAPMRSRWKDPVVMGLAVVAAGAIGAAVYTASRTNGTADRLTAAVLPLELRYPTDVPFNELGRAASLAPDGTFLVYVGVDPEKPGNTMLWRRNLDELTARPIPGTQNAQSPRVAADGKSIIFIGRLTDGTRNVQRRVSLDGGTVRNVMFPSVRTALDNTDRMFEVDTVTSTFTAVTATPQTEVTGVAPTIRVPQVIDVSPDGKRALFVRRDSVYVHEVGKAGRRVLVPARWARFLDDQSILFLDASNAIVAARLDSRRESLASTPVTVVENVTLTPTQRPFFDVAADGTAIYTTGGDAVGVRLVWVNGDGRVDSIPGAESKEYQAVRLSPDGRFLAVTIGAVLGHHDVWIERLGTTSRVPIAIAQNNTSVTWAPDGQSVLFPRSAPNMSFGYTVMRRSAGAETPEDSIRGPWPAGSHIGEIEFHASGAQAIRTNRIGQADRDLWIRNDSLSPFRAVSAEKDVQERAIRFSPDGRHVSFVSDFTKREDVYVQSSTGNAGRMQVSVAGGREPAWALDGSALFYRALDGWMMRAPVTRRDPLEFGAPVRLFDASRFASNQFTITYDVARDGRFLMRVRDAQPARTDVVIVRNWASWVRKRLETAN